MMHRHRTRTRTNTNTNTRTSTGTTRLSVCNRHPSKPVTGFCALCLRDRLAGLDSPAPEFRRSKSVAVEKREGLIDLSLDQRRSSCDVRPRCSLSDLFGVESKGFGATGGEIRVSDGVIVRNEIDDDEEEEVVEGDLKTMKEIIEIELESKSKLKSKAKGKGGNNFVPGASVLSEKLRKWRIKRMEKKQRVSCINSGNEKSGSRLERVSQIRDTQSEVADYGFGRRSCDTEPRFSIDAHRVSVEDPRFSLDEHRASWDGYMMARTIPRLTPMLSVVDNMTLGMENMQMRSIHEDDGTSSSSMKGLGGDDVKSASNARVSPASDAIFEGTKLVITEKELKEWHLNSIKNIESASNAPDSTSNTSPMNIKGGPSTEPKKNVIRSKWKKVCNLWSHKQKVNDRKSLEHIPGTRIVRNTSYINSTPRRYSTSDVNSGLLRLYLSPFRNSRRNKSVKCRAPSMGINGLQLH